MSTAAADILAQLQSAGSDANLAGMARYGINIERAFGVPAPVTKQLAALHRGNQILAFELWESGYREARLMAAYMADPKAFTPGQMDSWIGDCDSWDVCDGVANQLFRRSPHAYGKALEWARAEPLYTRRAGFALMAGLALKSTKLDDADYFPYLECVLQTAEDERNMVKKGVNWALRQIGKRNPELNRRAIEVAENMLSLDAASAQWIATDALRELRGTKVQTKLHLEATP